MTLGERQDFICWEAAGVRGMLHSFTIYMFCGSGSVVGCDMGPLITFGLGRTVHTNDITRVPGSPSSHKGKARSTAWRHTVYIQSNLKWNPSILSSWYKELFRVGSSDRSLELSSPLERRLLDGWFNNPFSTKKVLCLRIIYPKTDAIRCKNRCCGCYKQM
jgi:hypothetical protein